jgi:hypothetical protein
MRKDVGSSRTEGHIRVLIETIKSYKSEYDVRLCFATIHPHSFLPWMFYQRMGCKTRGASVDSLQLANPIRPGRKLLPANP